MRRMCTGGGERTARTSATGTWSLSAGVPSGPGKAAERSADIEPVEAALAERGSSSRGRVRGAGGEGEGGLNDGREDRSPSAGGWRWAAAGRATACVSDRRGGAARRAKVPFTAKHREAQRRGGHRSERRSERRQRVVRNRPSAQLSRGCALAGALPTRSPVAQGQGHQGQDTACVRAKARGPPGKVGVGEGSGREGERQIVTVALLDEEDVMPSSEGDGNGHAPLPHRKVRRQRGPRVPRCEREPAKRTNEGGHRMGCGRGGALRRSAARARAAMRSARVGSRAGAAAEAGVSGAWGEPPP